MTARQGMNRTDFLQIYANLTMSRRSFVNAWQSSMKVHEIIAENRIRFAQRLNEMSEDLLTLSKEVEKNRKQVCTSAKLILSTVS